MASYLTVTVASYVAGVRWFIQMEVKKPGFEIELENQRSDIDEQRDAIDP